MIGILATGVVLSQNDDNEASSGRKDNDDEANTHTRQLEYPQLEYGAAHHYNDADVRPSSRTASILRQDTFAPPPIPLKPEYLRSMVSNIEEDNKMFDTNHNSMSDLEGHITDGQIGVSACHAEVHRPDLLRDIKKEKEEESCDSDASGSTIGGPAVQLWRKARGGKNAAARRKAKKIKSQNTNTKGQSEMKRLAQSEQSAATRIEGQDIISSEMVSASSRLSDVELRSKGPGYWLNATKKSVMSRHLPGNSVLLEFLAGSRIGASLVKNVSQLTPDQTGTLKGASVSTSTSNASIPQTDLAAYIPVLPSHLLWFFGMSNESSAMHVASKDIQDYSRGRAIMGGDLLTIAKMVSPVALIGMAYSSASAAWSTISDWSIAATCWFDAGLFSLPWAVNSKGLEDSSSSDDDAKEWEWASQDFDASSIENTPRPIYRRKKLHPSMQGNYTANQTSLSIFHFDDMGIPRRAMTRCKKDYVAV